MDIKRGYVKWTDKDGVFHKELLSDHAAELAKASPEQQLAAEEARRLADDGEKQTKIDEAVGADTVKETLTALKAAPADVLTSSDLVAVDDGKGGEKIVPNTERVTSNTLNDPNHVDDVKPDDTAKPNPPMPTPTPAPVTPA